MLLASLLILLPVNNKTAAERNYFQILYALSSITTSNKFGTNHFHIYSFKRILSAKKNLYDFSRAPTEEIYFQELIISFWVRALRIKPGLEFPPG